MNGGVSENKLLLLSYFERINPNLVKKFRVSRLIRMFGFEP